MNLRNIKTTVIEREKLVDYLLSPFHSKGRGKAEFFHTLGYDQFSWRSLERDIRALGSRDLVYVEDTSYGSKYVADGEIVGPNGRTAWVRTVWIVYFGTDVLKFLTAYPQGKANDH
jgi:hypothetical protein